MVEPGVGVIDPLPDRTGGVYGHEPERLPVNGAGQGCGHAGLGHRRFPPGRCRLSSRTRRRRSNDATTASPRATERRRGAGTRTRATGAYLWRGEIGASMPRGRTNCEPQLAALRPSHGRSGTVSSSRTGILYVIAVLVTVRSSRDTVRRSQFGPRARAGPRWARRPWGTGPRTVV